jgi:hypothetical protein
VTDPVALLTAMGHNNPTPEYVSSSASRVPVESWGSDHWSTLAFVECRIVDHRGKLSHDRMRCDADRHPVMYGAKPTRLLGSATKYPTRLKGGVELADHDDYDCLDDAIALGLLVADMPAAPAGTLVTGLVEAELMTRATYRLTERGSRVVAELRAHKADGGKFATFTPSAEAMR